MIVKAKKKKRKIGISKNSEKKNRQISWEKRKAKKKKNLSRPNGKHDYMLGVVLPKKKGVDPGEASSVARFCAICLTL